MEIKNQKLKDVKENKKYYSKSDGNFMDPERSLQAHKVLDRVAWVREWIYKISSRTHLDIGTKDGYLPLLLQAEGVDCIGVDPSSDSIAMARMKAQIAGLDCQYINAYAEDLNLEQTFDSVSCLEVIEHVPDPTKLLDCITKYGTYIFVSTPDINGRHGLEDAKRNQEHLRLYSKDELFKLMSKYGDVLDCVVRDDQICILIKRRTL